MLTIFASPSCGLVYEQDFGSVEAAPTSLSSKVINLRDTQTQNQITLPTAEPFIPFWNEVFDFNFSDMADFQTVRIRNLELPTTSSPQINITDMRRWKCKLCKLRFWDDIDHENRRQHDKCRMYYRSLIFCFGWQGFAYRIHSYANPEIHPTRITRCRYQVRARGYETSKS